MMSRKETRKFASDFNSCSLLGMAPLYDFKLPPKKGMTKGMHCVREVSSKKYLTRFPHPNVCSNLCIVTGGKYHAEVLEKFFSLLN